MKSSFANIVNVKSIVLLATVLATPGWSQSLPGPTRTVYKCEDNGKTVYSDSPCLGAKRLEVEPPRGVGKTMGPDVQRERHREMFADAIKPLTGMNAKELDALGRRIKLSPDAQRECKALDGQLPQLEHSEAKLSGAEREAVSLRLLSFRQRQRDLGC